MLTLERLKELLHYDPTTGVFTFRVPRGGKPAGTIAGARNFGPAKDRISIKIDRVHYYASNLAWFYMTGELYPKDGKIIDHRDGDGYNNRFGNLRVATGVQNATNKGVAKNNQLGHKHIGVWNGYYRVRFHNMKAVVFKTLEEAIQYRDEVLSSRGDEFTPPARRLTYRP
jgi:hypothetical protein